MPPRKVARESSVTSPSATFTTHWLDYHHGLLHVSAWRLDPVHAHDLSDYTLREEAVHSLTHGLGLVLSVGGLVALVLAASLHGDAWHIVGCTVFGVTLVLLYAASTLYHSARSLPAKRVFQKLDHAAIFLLIAGTYTPFTLANLRGGWGWSLLGVVWGLALLGITLEVTLPQKSRQRSIAIHLLMGWLLVVAIEPLARSVHPVGLVLLVLGGLTYSVGVVFFAWEKLPYNHAIWHLFVLAGSALHFSCVYAYVIPSGLQ
ncbi:MAG: hemolysin III family protein [Deltaproteobacteria bacterium]|nr:hemolysin III family protein [Deltaproteobacteria bacterium]MBW2698930.1 hemolysin III family protein [Deltaproteobacteria bacterium]